MSLLNPSSNLNLFQELLNILYLCEASWWLKRSALVVHERQASDCLMMLLRGIVELLGCLLGTLLKELLANLVNEPTKTKDNV